MLGESKPDGIPRDVGAHSISGQVAIRLGLTISDGRNIPAVAATSRVGRAWSANRAAPTAEPGLAEPQRSTLYQMEFTLMVLQLRKSDAEKRDRVTIYHDRCCHGDVFTGTEKISSLVRDSICPIGAA